MLLYASCPPFLCTVIFRSGPASSPTREMSMWRVVSRHRSLERLTSAPTGDVTIALRVPVHNVHARWVGCAISRIVFQRHHKWSGETRYTIIVGLYLWCLPSYDRELLRARYYRRGPAVCYSTSTTTTVALRYPTMITTTVVPSINTIEVHPHHSRNSLPSNKILTWPYHQCSVY